MIVHSLCLGLQLKTESQNGKVSAWGWRNAGQWVIKTGHLSLLSAPCSTAMLTIGSCKKALPFNFGASIGPLILLLLLMRPPIIRLYVAVLNKVLYGLSIVASVTGGRGRSRG